MVVWKLYASDESSEKEFKPKGDMSDTFKPVDCTCPISGETFTTRGTFWKHIVESKLDPENMTYDKVVEDTSIQDNLTKLLDKSYLNELWYGYFEDTSKMKKKSLENLLGSINLDLYITLLKVYRGDSCISEVLEEEGESEAETEEEEGGEDEVFFSVVIACISISSLSIYI